MQENFHLDEGVMINEAYKTESDSEATEDMIRVMLFDSRETVREGLRFMLGNDESIKVIGEATTTRELLDKVEALTPDVVIIGEIESRNYDTSSTIRCLGEGRSPCRVIVINDERRFLVPAVKAGAVGFLKRKVSRSELTAAIRIVHLWHRILADQVKGSHFALVNL
jgi:DNA-binding NarL/FixJ family response regulator